MVQAVVREWNEDEGWGVIDSSETPGGCWAHFSAIATPVIESSGDYVMREYAVVNAGDTVDLTWEQARQDGFNYRAVTVRPEH